MKLSVQGRTTTGFTPRQHGKHMEAARIGAGKQKTIHSTLGSEQSQEQGAEKGHGPLAAAASDAGGAGGELNCFAANAAIAAWRMLALPLLVRPQALPARLCCLHQVLPQEFLALPSLFRCSFALFDWFSGRLYFNYFSTLAVSQLPLTDVLINTS